MPPNKHWTASQWKRVSAILSEDSGLAEHQEACAANHSKLCIEKGVANSVETGKCPSCGKNIFDKITTATAATCLLTSCYACNYSFCE